jgi:hypothetical protein
MISIGLLFIILMIHWELVKWTSGFAEHCDRLVVEDCGSEA